MCFLEAHSTEERWSVKFEICRISGEVYKLVREVISDKMTFEKNLERNKGMDYMSGGTKSKRQSH
jgi:hypothetical protein